MIRHLRRKPTPAPEPSPLPKRVPAVRLRDVHRQHVRDETIERLSTLPRDRVPTAKILEDHLALVGVA